MAVRRPGCRARQARGTDASARPQDVAPWALATKLLNIHWIDAVAALCAVPVLIIEGRRALRGEDCVLLLGKSRNDGAADFAAPGSTSIDLQQGLDIFLDLGKICYPLETVANPTLPVDEE